MRVSIERLQGIGEFDRYDVRIGKVKGEVIAPPSRVDDAVTELIYELSDFKSGALDG